MCGIVGIVERDLSRPVPAGDVQRMVRTLNHRGPDEEGSVLLPGVGLAMRRLSIVDIAGGQQPFANEDGTMQVVANGEIYNFPQVKQDLESRGHRFRSRSDIEVLVHAYEEWGEGFLSRIRGMFALALWDGRTRTLIAARDRAGEKPLYYAKTPQGLRLASEIKALLSRPEVDRTLDVEALDQFLTYEYVIAPRTIFKSIRKLPAAHYLTYRDGEITVKRYWDAADVAVREWSDADAAAALRETLGRAVRSQMMSDVPLGLFLSGGIDSSAVGILLRDAPGASDVSSFSMGFDDGSYNELPYAREVAALCGTRHYEGTVTPDVAVTLRQADRPPRRAVRGRVAVSDLPGVADGKRAREGRADRRRRRRALRRLRRLRSRSAGGQVGKPAAGRRREGRGSDSRPRAADDEEEGRRQQGAAVRRRPGAWSEVDCALPLDDVSLGGGEAIASIRRPCATACSRPTSTPRSARPSAAPAATTG